MDETALPLLNRFGHEITPDEATALLASDETLYNRFGHALLPDEAERLIELGQR